MSGLFKLTAVLPEDCPERFFLDVFCIFADFQKNCLKNAQKPYFPNLETNFLRRF